MSILEKKRFIVSQVAFYGLVLLGITIYQSINYIDLDAVVLSTEGKSQFVLEIQLPTQKTFTRIVDTHGIFNLGEKGEKIRVYMDQDTKEILPSTVMNLWYAPVFLFMILSLLKMVQKD